MENQHLPTKYMKIEGEDKQLFFISQCQPWAQHQGMPLDPLQNTNSYGNQWKYHNVQVPPQYSQPNWNNAWQNNLQQTQWSQFPNQWQPPQGNWQSTNQ